ncbi:hypothetical protein [Pseudolactococcus laudensis]|uniref:hypothetical protein n=1 Tax=Pseudolactococcus laudensis TaxID=1494461 RepID=UPI00068760F3
MAVYVDLTTGEKLTKPVVTPVNVKNEIEQEVKVKMTIGYDGLPVFSWDKVKSADYYYVVSLDYSNEKGYNNQQAFVQGQTDKLTWSPKDATHLRTIRYLSWNVVMLRMLRNTEQGQSRFSKIVVPLMINTMQL